MGESPGTCQVEIQFSAQQGTASHRNLAQLGHKNFIFAYFKCSFMDFFLSKYELTQAIKLFY